MRLAYTSAVMLLLAAGFVAVAACSDDAAPPTPSQTAVAPPAPPTEAPAAVTALGDAAAADAAKMAPPAAEGTIGQADELARRLIDTMCGAPQIARWAKIGNPLGRFVAAVHRVAAGRSPAQALPFLRPRAPLQTEQRDDRTVISKKGYARYNRIANVIAAIDVERCAGAYRELKPFLEERYAEFAPAGQTFEQTLTRAIRRLLAVRPRRLEVQQHIESYRLTNPRLEALPPANKHLLRMGPRNMRVVQDKLRDLAAELGLEVGNR